LFNIWPQPSKNAERVLRRKILIKLAVVFDREDVFIGSFDLDPRSGDINTEAGLYVESPELAAQVIEFLDEGVHPNNSYRVTQVDEREQRYD
jgi:putative cardiolipin synthase